MSCFVCFSLLLLLFSMATASSSSALRRNNVVVLGAGAVGFMYGGRLLEAELTGKSNNNVNFLCRSEADRCLKNGVRLTSPDGNYFFRPEDLKNKIHKSTSTIDFGPSGTDWIICCLKSVSLEDSDSAENIRASLEPLIGEQTRILVIMNGLDPEEKFSKWFGSRRVFGGMAFTCVNREIPADKSLPMEIKHIAYSALLIGHCEDNEQELTQHAKPLWDHSVLESRITTAKSLLYSRWSKLCWNIPFNGLAVAMSGLSVDVIANDPNLRQIADAVMTDTINLANAHILFVHNSQEKDGLPTLLNVEETKKYCWHLSDTMGPYKSSTVLDLVNGNRLEMEYLFRRPLQIATEMHNYQGNLTSWSHLETIIRQVLFVESIARKRQEQGKKWIPTEITE